MLSLRSAFLLTATPANGAPKVTCHTLVGLARLNVPGALSQEPPGRRAQSKLRGNTARRLHEHRAFRKVRKQTAAIGHPSILRE
jgi:hypothetical protein